MFLKIVVSLALFFGVIMVVQADNVAFPTEEERAVALESIKKDDVGPAVAYYGKIYDYYLAKSNEQFDLEKFRDARRKSGVVVTESRERELEQIAVKLHGVAQALYRKDAAEAIYHKSVLLMLDDSASAIRGFEIAISLDPTNQKYHEALQMGERIKK